MLKAIIYQQFRQLRLINAWRPVHYPKVPGWMVWNHFK